MFRAALLRRIMKGEIIAIGNELTSGRILNTTSGFAARHLYDAGYEIYAMHTIGDTPSLIGEALKRAINRVDFVIVTGGLGSTDDDLTTEAVSKALNRPTMPNLEILSQIRSHLDAVSGNPISPLEKLAWLPKGAEALSPKNKMAGYQLVHNSKPIFFLPGVPYQMEYLLIEHVLPRLTIWYSDPNKSTRQKMLRVFSLSETDVNERLSTINFDRSINIGYYPVYPELHVSITIRGQAPQHCDMLVSQSTRLIYEALGDAIYGQNQDNLEIVVGRLLKKHKKSIALAESCTGGLISQKITRVPGSSAYYLGGITAYANSFKEKNLGVNPDLLQTHGAVSKEVAGEMAKNIRNSAGADIGLSVTGIAGPDGGSEEKPVGTVYIGIATREILDIRRFEFDGNREQIQEITAATALDLIRKYLLNIP